MEGTSFGNWLATAGDERIESYLLEKQEEIDEFRKEAIYEDLHVHTCYSDGDLKPNELLEKAKNELVGTIAITDHDTILGLKNIVYGHDETKFLKIIAGIELTAKADKGRMHILGYGIDINNRELNDKCNELRNNSIYSVIAIINQLKIDYGVMFNAEDIQRIINTIGNVGRPHVAKLCVKYGYAKDNQEAFDKYLNDVYSKTRIFSNSMDYKKCIKLIKTAGGIPVLAHPNQLKINDQELDALLNEMVLNGLEGIEAFHSRHSISEIYKYLMLADRYNLLVSGGGSDYHGDTMDESIKLGRGINDNIKIKHLSILDKVKYTKKRVK